MLVRPGLEQTASRSTNQSLSDLVKRATVCLVFVLLTFGRTREGWMPTPHKVFLSFYLEDKTSAPDFFSSCSLITRTDFEMSLVMVSCYGYEI